MCVNPFLFVCSHQLIDTEATVLKYRERYGKKKLDADDSDAESGGGSLHMFDGVALWIESTLDPKP